MSKLIPRFARDESGATAIEYALMATLIAMVIVGAVTLIGVTVSTPFNDVGSAL